MVIIPIGDAPDGQHEPFRSEGYLSKIKGANKISKVAIAVLRSFKS